MVAFLSHRQARVFVGVRLHGSRPSFRTTMSIAVRRAECLLARAGVAVAERGAVVQGLRALPAGACQPGQSACTRILRCTLDAGALPFSTGYCERAGPLLANRSSRVRRECAVSDDGLGRNVECGLAGHEWCGRSRARLHHVCRAARGNGWAAIAQARNAPRGLKRSRRLPGNCRRLDGAGCAVRLYEVWGAGVTRTRGTCAKAAHIGRQNRACPALSRAST